MNRKIIGLKSQICKEIDISPLSNFFPFSVFPFFFFSPCLHSRLPLSLSRICSRPVVFLSQERLDFLEGSRVSFLDIAAPSKGHFLLPKWLNVGGAEVVCFHIKKFELLNKDNYMEIVFIRISIEGTMDPLIA
jgi:hypothetical protein